MAVAMLSNFVNRPTLRNLHNRILENHQKNSLQEIIIPALMCFQDKKQQELSLICECVETIKGQLMVSLLVSHSPVQSEMNSVIAFYTFMMHNK